MAGDRWSSEIGSELATTTIGIICVTPENQERPWLNFEAGALAKIVNDNSRVCPFLYDMKSMDVTGPLAQFQGKEFDKASTWDVVNALRLSLPTPMEKSVISDQFERCWPEFKKNLKAIPEFEGQKPESRTAEEMLAELLSLSRNSESYKSESHKTIIDTPNGPMHVSRVWRAAMRSLGGMTCDMALDFQRITYDDRGLHVTFKDKVNLDFCSKAERYKIIQEVWLEYSGLSDNRIQMTVANS